jgi:hypothetical protein
MPVYFLDSKKISIEINTLGDDSVKKYVDHVSDLEDTKKIEL